MNANHARRLGNRHLLPNSKFNFPKQGRKVRLSISPYFAETLSGQHCAWMLTNLLSRQFCVISELEINAPMAAMLPGTALFGRNTTLKETLLGTASIIADDAMIIGEPSGRLPDCEVLVGGQRSDAPFAVSAIGDGWNIFVGKPSLLPEVELAHGARKTTQASCRSARRA